MAPKKRITKKAEKKPTKKQERKSEQRFSIYPDPHPTVSSAHHVNVILWEWGTTLSIILIFPYLAATAALYLMRTIQLSDGILIIGFLVSSWISYGALGQVGLLKISNRLRAFAMNTNPRKSQLLLYHATLAALYGGPLYLLSQNVEQWQSLRLTVAYWLGLFTILELLRFCDVLITKYYPRPITKLSADIQARSMDRPLIVHWTDLHLTKSDTTSRLDRVDGYPGGNQALKRLIQQYGNGVLESAKLILVTGDITDTGQEEEWQAFFQAVPRKLLNKMILVPGNHEVNIPHGVTNQRDRLFRVEQAVRSPLRLIRWIRCLLAMEAIQGQKALVYAEQGRLVTLAEHLKPLRKNLDSYRPCLDVGCADIRQLWRRKEIEEIILKSFPMVITLRIEDDELVIIVLNSNDHAVHLGTNAFGCVDREQLIRLARLIGKLSTQGSPNLHSSAVSSDWVNGFLGTIINNDPHRRYLVTMHHHIGIPWIGSDYVQRAMTINNTYDVLHFLRPIMPTVLFNGHRHLGYLGEIVDKTGEVILHVAAGSSTTLGDEDETKDPSERSPGFRAFDLAWDHARPGVRIRSTQWYGLSPDALSSELPMTRVPVPNESREDADDSLRAPGVLRFGWLLFMQPFQLLALFKRWGIERDPSVFQVRRYLPQGSHPANSLAKLSFLWLVFIIPVTVALAAGLLRLARVPVDWAGVWVGLTSAITLGCLAQMAIGVTFGAIVGTVFGVAGAMAMGVLFSPPGTHAGGLAFGILFGAAAGFGATPLLLRALSPDARLARHLPLILLLAVGIGGSHLAHGRILPGGAASMAEAVGAGISFLVMILRVPIYVLEAIGTVMLLLLMRRCPARRKQLARYLPIRHDDLIHLPLPGLPSILIEVGRDDLALGEELIAQASASLAQKRAARRAKEALTAGR